ncbi:hypothetical protein AMIS_31970 [Actinoplanes missouriensis 431]|uniref:Uncharacterized protein n=1 Tax=Actinoplanes missouriensis (strain ATCC 14538 / DSM 43046 / CBS 188.64 / JCM 3121 / NBRC 102363 / NCIMB 12654 / NRRL B-3342 / UNCC 431) TaxID=512565 RepID=I0H5Y0_ACTM4|nr:hypothetical protein AMIS_31970 [Actinoplanes missouriensis 431]
MVCPSRRWLDMQFPTAWRRAGPRCRDPRPWFSVRGGAMICAVLIRLVRRRFVVGSRGLGHRSGERRSAVLGLSQLAQTPGMALCETPRAVPLMLPPELLGSRRVIAAQRPAPQMPGGKQ